MPSECFPNSSRHLQVHQRLERWRRRERTRRPGLFPDSVSLASSHSVPTVSLQTLRSGFARFLIDGSPILVCDACGTLLAAGDADRAASSASTLPPQNPVDDPWICCNVCSFPTPLGYLRRLLHLPHDRGPHFPLQVARALLVEAVGAPKSMSIKDPALRAWMLDRECRTAGLDALSVVLGICDEQLTDNDRSESVSDLDVQTMVAVERFLDTTIPEKVMPRVPFSITQLCQQTASTTKLTQLASKAKLAVERAHELVTEAARIWSGQDAQHAQDSETKAAILKLRALGRDYVVQQTKARIYCHSALHIANPIQVTQTERPSSTKTQS